MTRPFYVDPLFIGLGVLAVASLVVIVKLSLQPVLSRLRILKHIESDGARQAALEERVHALQGCLALIQEVDTATKEGELLHAVLQSACNILHADGCAVDRGGEVWTGTAAGTLDATLDAELRTTLAGLGESGAAYELEPHLLAEPVAGRGEETGGWIVVARDAGRVPFARETRGALAAFATAVRLAFARLALLRGRARERERREESEDSRRRAKLMLSRTEELGLQGELAHHLVREMTGPVTGILGLAQFLDQDAAATHRAEVRALLEEGLRCKRILAQFAAAALADKGQHSSEVVDLTHVLREVVATAGARFRTSRVADACRIPARALLLHTNPTTLSRVLTDLLFAGLDMAGTGGEVRLDVQQLDAAIQLDFFATSDPARAAEEMPDLPPDSELAGDLWRNLETIHLAALQAMSGCLGGRLDVAHAEGSLRARLLLPVGKAAIPLRADLLSPYGASTEIRHDRSDGGRRLIESRTRID